MGPKIPICVALSQTPANTMRPQILG